MSDDPIVRKAAEEVTDSLGWPISRDGRVEFIAQLLTPFFAAARKEAREGAIKRCSRELEWLAGRRPSHHDVEPRDEGSDALRWAAMKLLALCSKPEEPA